MPNWCDTTYICEGPKKQIQQLYQIIKDCDKGKYNTIKNDFGNLWLGNLLTACGCPDPTKQRCRGDIYDYNIRKDGTLEIWMNTAWAEQADVRKYIIKKFPNITVYYRDVETGCSYFHSNDIDNKYFKDYAFILDEDDNYHTVDSESELQKELKKYRKRNINLPDIEYFTYDKD